MAILSTGCKPDDFELYNSLKLSFTNIWGICSNFADCESFPESNSPNTLALCETKPEWLNWFWQFLGVGLYSFNPKGFYYLLIRSHSLCEGKTSFLGLISTDPYEKTLQVLNYVFDWLYFTQFITSFFLYWSPSSSLCTAFDSVSSNIDEVRMLIKQKSPSTPRNLTLGTFGEMPIVFSTKADLLHLLYLMAWRCCLLHLIKLKFLLKTFLGTLILMIQVSLYLFSLLELIWNCIFLLLSKWFKRS